jgi:PAT family beta-lactamase induction signal transducer AmpG
MADAIGWRDFFIFTILTGIPGMVMLARFVPWGVRDPVFLVAAARRGPPLTNREVAVRASIAALAGWGLSFVLIAALSSLAGIRSGRGFDLLPAARALLRPTTPGEWVTSASLVLTALGVGLATAAVLVARQSTSGDDRSE